MHSRTCLAVGLAIALTTALADRAEAQTSRMHLGPHVAYNFDAEEFGLGAQFSVPLGQRLEFYPSVDFYFVDPGSLWALNADVKYRASTSGSLDWLYLGAGLNLATRSVNDDSNTDAGLNLIAGIESLKGWVHPFAEGRLTIGDETSFQIAGGLNFTLGGPH